MCQRVMLYCIVVHLSGLTTLIFFPIEILCSGGLETEKMYPYEGSDDKCKFAKSEAVVYINGSVAISKDENGKSGFLQPSVLSSSF